MNDDRFQIGIVTDAVSGNLSEALQFGAQWGLSRFELREGASGRFPLLSPEDVRRIDDLVQEGGCITAVSPGIFRGHVEDRERWRPEVERTVPDAIELARRFACGVMIGFGFSACDATRAGRLQVLKAFEQAANLVADAAMVLALENEPGFWVDRPDDTIGLLEEIGHPAIKLNWDPANLHRGGLAPTPEIAERLAPWIVNLHVKDFTPDDDDAPWRPLGRGIVPWKDLLPALVDVAGVNYGTLDTQCEPRVTHSEMSLAYLRDLVGQ